MRCPSPSPTHWEDLPSPWSLRGTPTPTMAGSQPPSMCSGILPYRPDRIFDPEWVGAFSECSLPFSKPWASSRAVKLERGGRTSKGDWGVFQGDPSIYSHWCVWCQSHTVLKIPKSIYSRTAPEGPSSMLCGLFSLSWCNSFQCFICKFSNPLQRRNNLIVASIWHTF